jgi:IPTL-CTERM motif
MTTVMACDCNKCVWHKMLTCAQVECMHAAIPTVSQWGLVVLTLLLLTGAKVYFGRRPTSAING